MRFASVERSDAPGGILAAMSDRLTGASDEEIRQKIAPDTIRSNLVRAGLVLATWELIQNEVETKVRDFYWAGFDEQRETLTHPDYKTKVLDLHKYPFEASLLWLIESGAIGETQAQTLRSFREYRNKVDHEMPSILVEVGHDIDISRIREAKDVISALGRFWYQIDVETDPEVLRPVPEGATGYSGMELLLMHLLAAAEGG
jgi:hypothetical protein